MASTESKTLPTFGLPGPRFYKANSERMLPLKIPDSNELWTVDPEARAAQMLQTNLPDIQHFVISPHHRDDAWPEQSLICSLPFFLSKTGTVQVKTDRAVPGQSLMNRRIYPTEHQIWQVCFWISNEWLIHKRWPERKSIPNGEHAGSNKNGNLMIQESNPWGWLRVDCQVMGIFEKI